MKTYIFLILSFFLFNHTIISAQVDELADLYKIELLNGNEFIGKVITKTSENIEIETSDLGVISIPMKEVKKIEPIEENKIKNGKYYFDNTQSTRYFFAPNGYGLKKGEGYYQNTWIFYNQVSYGVSDYFSIGGGLVPLFLFNGAPTPIWVTPKVSIPLVENKINLGVGVLAGTVIGADDGGFGIAFGTATFGSKDQNVTVGTGYGFTNGNWSESPAITISGLFRVGEKGYIITENYAISSVNYNYNSNGDLEKTHDWNTIISIGGRHIWKRVSIDYGVFIPIIASDFRVALPWLSFNIPFEK